MPTAVTKRRSQPEGYVRETEEINSRKDQHKGVHKFEAAKWTHPNGHPRCKWCGQEESMAPECNREATQAEIDARHAEWEREFSKRATSPRWKDKKMIAKAGIPLWDGDGVQGAGQPRDRLGRWVSLPGTSLLKKIGAWELEDGSFGVFRDGEEEPFKTFKTKKAANNLVAKLIKEDAQSYVRDKVLPKERKKHSEHQKKRQEQQRQILSEQAEAAASRRRAPVASPSPGKSKPGRRSMRMTTDPLARIELPGRPTLDQRNKSNAWAKENLPTEEAKYAGLISRLAGKGISQDPTKRGEMSKKYGIPAGRLVQIEQEVYTQMFPAKTSRERRRKLGGGASHTSPVQTREMKKHGALKAYALAPGEEGNRFRPERMFKATKGEHKGKWVKVSWNGTATEMTEQEAAEASSESKVFWTRIHLRDKERMERLRTSRRKAMGDFLRKHGEDVPESLGELVNAFHDLEKKLDVDLVRKAKIKVAKEWAKEQGYDPTDSFWWSFYWNDPGLARSQTEAPDEGFNDLRIELGEALEHEKMDPKLLEGILALPDDIDSRRMRGHRPDSPKALPGDEDFEEASPDARVVDPEWEARNRDREIEHNRRLRMAFDRYKKKHPNTKLSIEEFADQYYNNKLRIPGGGGRGIEKSENPYCMVCGVHGDKPFHETNEHSVSKANPLWDGDGVQGVGQPRGHRGRWVKTGRGALGAVSRALDLADAEVRLHHGSTASRSAAGRTGVFDHRRKTIPDDVKLSRLPHSGQESPTGKGGKPIGKMDPRKALYARNNGATKISNKRLQEIYDNFFGVPGAKGKPMTAAERNLLMSAGAREAIDGTDSVKVYVVRDRSRKPKPRYFVMNTLRKEIANRDHKGGKKAERGAGGHVVRRQDIDRSKKDYENEKRVASGRNKTSKAFRQSMMNDFGDGKKAKCIFCGKNVTTEEVSPERMKPGPMGGKYERGNVAPAHEKCNTAVGGNAQHNAELYYQNMMVKFMKMYEKMPPAQQKKMGFVFSKNRGALGKRPA